MTFILFILCVCEYLYWYYYFPACVFMPVGCRHECQSANWYVHRGVFFWRINFQLIPNNVSIEWCQNLIFSMYIVFVVRGTTSGFTYGPGELTEFLFRARLSNAKNKLHGIFFITRRLLLLLCRFLVGFVRPGFLSEHRIGQWEVRRVLAAERHRAD